MNIAAMRLLFAGSGEFGIPTLRALVAHGASMVRVFTQPDRPAGRGRELMPTPLASAALAMGLTVVRTADINSEPLPDCDAMIVIAFGQKIGESAVARGRFGGINLHASLLPKYRGAAPINWAIIRGETTSGNSVIRLAKRMDAGDVLAQSSLAIGEIETAGELHDRLADDGAPLVCNVLGQLRAGGATETAQDESLATLAPKLSRKDASLRFDDPPAVVARHIRGLYPWPGCRVRLLDGAGGTVSSLRLVRARVGEADDVPRWNYGELTLAGFVRCGDGCLEILEVQPDGKRPMPLSDFRRGHGWMAGMRLSSVE